MKLPAITLASVPDPLMSICSLEFPAITLRAPMVVPPIVFPDAPL
jgi:hypothetical protein